MNKKIFARLIAMLTKVKPLHPLLEPYLWSNMVPLFCKKNTSLHEQDDVVDKAMETKHYRLLKNAKCKATKQIGIDTNVAWLF